MIQIFEDALMELIDKYMGLADDKAAEREAIISAMELRIMALKEEEAAAETEAEIDRMGG